MFKIYKKQGETPLEAIKRIREKFPDFSAEKMTYAGRLDPLAEGVLLILVGDECKNKEPYLRMDKEYEVEFLLGVKTDTGDLMGLGAITQANDVSDEGIAAAIDSLIGRQIQKYPKFSSPGLCGKKEIFKEIEIKSIVFLGKLKITSLELLKVITKKISLVRGDFRQSVIIEEWKKILSRNQRFSIIKCLVKCTSGTYIRVLAQELGIKLNTVACVYSLKRTKVGVTDEKDCLNF